MQPNELVKNLRPGQPVFKVYALGINSFIEEIVFSQLIIADSRVTNGSGWWIVDHNGSLHSLHDMNAHTVPNAYNLHKLCISRKIAEQYKFLCEVCEIGSMRSDDGWWDWGDDQPEDY